MKKVASKNSIWLIIVGVIAISFSVNLVEMAPVLVPGLDRDIGRALERYFRQRGITVATSTRVMAIDADSDVLTAKTVKHDQESSWEGDAVLIAVGRRPASESLNLMAAGVERDERGTIVVNERLETSVAGIYAAGDVTGGIMLAHAAAEQGEVVADNLLGGERTYSSAFIPSAVFTTPEIGSVGMTEAAALAAEEDIVTAKLPMRALGRARAANEIEGMFKIVARRQGGALLGIHILGARATELIAAAACALQNGFTVATLARTVQAHPTFAEGLRDVARLALDKVVE